MIVIKKIKKSFDNHLVLNELDMVIDKGKTQVIIGQSGCGKSVLLKHIIGLLKPDEGEITINGNNITNISDKQLNIIRKKMGMVFQGSALFDSLNVLENVGFSLFEHTRLKLQTIKERVIEKLELVNLKDVLYKMPAELSGGMQKRVALARAVIMEPEIILFDEPTTGLDPITADSINDLIINTHKRLGVTSIVVTHDMVSSYKIADNIAMMYKGKIIETGTPDEIKNTNNPIVHQFINGLAKGPITD